MVLEGGHGRGGVAGLDCRHQRPMTLGRQYEIALALRARNLEAMVVDQAAVQDRIQGGQVCIVEQTAVEVAVEGGEPHLVILPRGLLHGLDQRLQIGKQAAAGVAQGAQHAGTFDLLADAEHLDGFVRRAVRDLRAAMAAPVHQSFLLELQQGFPHRALAAAETGGKFQFHQGFAGSELAEHDVVLEGVEGDRRAGDRARPGALGAQCRVETPRCWPLAHVSPLCWRHLVGVRMPLAIIIIDIDNQVKGWKEASLVAGSIGENAMAGIGLRDIRKSYGTHTVIHGVDLDIAEGEFLVLVGPSGCGKSTLLRMVAGLEEITGGEMRIGDKVVNALAPAERNIAMVFQDYALYPHMTVAENMGFGLRMRDQNAQMIDQRVRQAAETLKLAPLLERRPGQLSGGQRQRVAMGRAIVRDPQAFLFDEPLSNLDAGLRVEMRLEIAKLHRRIQATTVYVTHDQVEAMTLADRIVVMNAGRMEQVGPPLDLYHRPASLFVARFIGSPTMNTVELKLNGDGELPIGKARIAVPWLSGAAGTPIILGIRAEDLSRCDASQAWFTGELAMVERLGGQTFGYLDTGGERMVTVEFPRHSTVKVGDQVSVRGEANVLHLFDGKSGRRLEPA